MHFINHNEVYTSDLHKIYYSQAREYINKSMYNKMKPLSRSIRRHAP